MIRRARTVGGIAHGFALGALAAFSIFPVYLLTIESLKTVREDMFGPSLIVLHPTLEWYADFFEPARWVIGGAVVRVVPYLVWAKNSLIVFAGAIAVILVTSIAAGYALGRLRPPKWQAWRRVLFASYVIPQVLIFIPLYILIFRVRLDDHLLSLVLAYPALAIPFCTWLFSLYFQRLPASVEESAFIEGAGRLTAFYRIILPMGWPVVVTAGLFALGIVSSDFLLAGVFLPSEFHQTMAAAVGAMSVDDEDLGIVAAYNLGAMMIVPVSAAFAAVYVRGLIAAMIEGA
jgi:multiple sugar transport system permease protein